LLVASPDTTGCRTDREEYPPRGGRSPDRSGVCPTDERFWSTKRRPYWHDGHQLLPQGHPVGVGSPDPLTAEERQDVGPLLMTCGQTRMPAPRRSFLGPKAGSVMPCAPSRTDKNVRPTIVPFSQTRMPAPRRSFPRPKRGLFCLSSSSDRQECPPRGGRSSDRSGVCPTLSSSSDRQECPPRGGRSSDRSGVCPALCS
jgi:hypothetical protein